MDAGDVGKVTTLLETAPADISKSLKKKLIKNAEIAAKKAAKGTPPAQPVKTATEKTKPAAAAAAEMPPTAPPATPTGSSDGVVGTAESAIVGELLQAIEALGIPDETMAKLRQNQAALGLSIAPQVSSLRNATYAEGFDAA